MPSMIESVVMRKCNVSYKQSKQIVAMARDFLRLPEDSNLLWSKELENACILVYNSTNCEDSVGVTEEKRVATTKPSLQKTKSSSNMKRDLLERPVTKERKARSLSKSRTRKTPKSPTVNSECTNLPRSSKGRESLTTSSSHGQSSSRGRRVDEVSKNDALIKSARNLQGIGDSNDMRSSRPRRNISEISSSSRTSDRSFSSKSPSSSDSQRSKSRSVRDMDNSYPDLNSRDVSKTTSVSRKSPAECIDKQKMRLSSSQSNKVPEVLRRPRSNSEGSSEREKHSRKGSRKSLLISTNGDISKTELSRRTTSQERRPQRSSEAADTNMNSSQRYSSPESPSSRSARPEDFSVAIDKSGHSISRARGPDSKRSSLTMNPKSNHSTTETKAKTKRVDDSEENWARSRSVSSAKSHSKGRPAESKFFGSDDDDDSSSCDSFACALTPSIVRMLQPKESKGSSSSSPVTRRPRSPGPRIGANSECNITKLMPSSHDRSNHLIRLEKSMGHEADERPRKEERKVHRISVSPTRDQRTNKKDRTTPVSPISSVRLPSPSNSSVPSNKVTTKKSAVSRRRLSIEEVAKACEADPALRDAIVSNFGKDRGGIRLGTYRAAPKVAGHGDEFTKSFEEWAAHNDDSSESTNASSKSPALQQYSMDNPLSKFIGKLSDKSHSNKDENTVSTGSESSTKSKTRMIPVMKSTMSPPKKTIPNGGTTGPSSVKPKRIVKNPSNLTLMSTDFTDPFTAKKKVTTSKCRRLVGSSFDTAPKASKVAGCSIGESVLSRTSNTTESTFSSSKDDSEDDIPMVDYAVPSFHDEYSEDQIFPEFSEGFTKGHHGLTRKDSMRVSSRADHGTLPSSFRGKSSSPLSSKKKSLSSRSSSLGPPKLPQRQRSMIRGS